LPQIQVWINNDDAANVEKLVKTLNDAMVDNKDKRLKAFFIFVDESGDKVEPKLTALAEKAKSDAVCLTYLSSKDRGVRAYKINVDAEVKNTVLLYRNKTIVSKHVNLVADEKGLSTLKTSIDELLK
jgi:hypothetical protein